MIEASSRKESGVTDGEKQRYEQRKGNRKMSAEDSKLKADIKNIVREAVDPRFAQVNDEISSLSKNINQKFNNIDERFNSIDSRFNSIDSRFNSIDESLKNIESLIKGQEPK